MHTTVQFKVGETAHLIEMTGSKLPSEFEVKQLVAEIIDAPRVRYAKGKLRPSREQEMDDRLKSAGVTDFKIL